MARDVVVRITAEDSFSSVFQKFNTALKDTQQTTDATEKATTKQATAFDNLATAANGLILSYVGLKGIQLVGEMVELGTAANRTDAIFRQLTQGIGGYAANMAALREITGGIVSDMDLQQGANKLLQMGLASTSDEVAKLTELAVKLGASMGQDAAKSVNDFSLLLSNQSILRLDNFGISSAKVREEIKRLQAQFEGMDRSEAFKLAVLKIGQESLNRLGNAADSAITPLGRFQTFMVNVGQDISQRFTNMLNNAAQAVEGLVGIVGIYTGTSPLIAEAQKAADLSAEAFAEKWGDSFHNYMTMNNVMTQGVMDSLGGMDFIKDTMAAAWKEYQANPGMDLTQIMTDVLHIDDPFLANYLAGHFSTAFLMAMAGEQMQAQRDAFASQLAEAEAANEKRRQEARWNSYTSFWRSKQVSPEANPFYQAAGITQEQALAAAQAWAQSVRNRIETQPIMEQAALNSFVGYIQGANAFLAGGTPKYLENADAYQRELDQINASYEYMKSLNEAGLISDQQLDDAGKLRDRVAEMADQADRAVQAFQNMKLSDVFGTGGGGMAGQMTDAIIAQMRQAGKSDAEIMAAKRALDLGSGRETGASLAFQEQIVPLLANMKPEEMAQAVGNLQQFMQIAMQYGLTPDQIKAGLSQATGFNQTGQGGTYKVTAGQTAGDIMRDLNMTLQQVLALTGAPSDRLIRTGAYNLPGGYAPMQGYDPMALVMSILSGGLPTQAGAKGGLAAAYTGLGAGSLGADIAAQAAGKTPEAYKDFSRMPDTLKAIQSSVEDVTGGVGQMYEAFGETVGEVDRIRGGLENLPTTKEITINLTVNDTMGLLPMLTMLTGGGATSLGNIVANSGGNVPGTPAGTGTGTGSKTVGSSKPPNTKNKR